jgi:hypothetical protein
LFHGELPLFNRQHPQRGTLAQLPLDDSDEILSAQRSAAYEMNAELHKASFNSVVFAPARREFGVQKRS